MAIFPATPIRPERAGSPQCPGAPSSHMRRPTSDPTPPMSFNIPSGSYDSPVTPVHHADNEGFELAKNVAHLDIKDDHDTLKEVVAADGSVVVSGGDAGVDKTPSPKKADDESPSSRRNGKGGILTTSNGRSGATNDPNWRQRGVRFQVSTNDPFATAENGNAATGDKPEGSGAFKPRGDRQPGTVSNVNAQALLPPDSCVFVANLSAQLADDQLEYKVQEKFEQFGNCYVKIKRDSRGMPFAFCQYENSKDAEKAIQGGRDMPIAGRLCRTEQAKVNRSLFLSRSTGGPISEAEARELLKGYGDLEKVWLSTPTDTEMFRLPDGIWVRFAFFQDCRDAQQSFKENPRFRLEQPPLPEEVRNRIGRLPVARTVVPRPTPTAQNVQSYGEQRTIYVGNLPQDATQMQLRPIFNRFGNIQSLEIVSRIPQYDGTANVFAFITYLTEAEARRATHFGRPITLHGIRLRVELREGRNPLGPASGSPMRRACPRSSLDSRDVVRRDSVMSRAAAAGVPPSTIMQIFGDETEAAPLAAAGPVYQVPYVHPYYANYYAAVAAQTSSTDYRAASSAAYGNGMSHAHTSGGQAQYAPVNMGQYGQGIVYASPYVYTPTVDANGNTILPATAPTNGTGNGGQGHH